MSIRFDKVKKLDKGQIHIHETDLELEKGSFNVFLGATLSGKTTLIRMIAGLDKPTSGRVLIDGKDAHRIPLQKRNIGMVYQEFINYPSYNVYENIAIPLRLKKISKGELDRKVRETADTLQLGKFLKRMPDELSGGQQQRLAIARALVKDADLLLFDEPLINLDYKLREQLRDELIDIIGDRDIIVVYATTEPLEALILEGNTVVLHEGRVLQTGATHGVFQNPSSVNVAQTFNNPPMNILDAELVEDNGQRLARLTDGTTLFLNGYLDKIDVGPFKVGFRASQISVFQNNPTDICVGGVVELAEISGSETFVHLRHNDVPIVVYERGTHPYKLGQQVDFFLKPQHLFAFDCQGNLIASPAN
ncbi:MAG: ABC transporter ATP-binding protein [Desulforhopalus sp.]